VIDVCTTAIGGENSKSGAERFTKDVLALQPDVVFIDYCINDRWIGVEAAQQAWRKMIQLAIEREVRVVLLTPTPDADEDILDSKSKLAQHADLVRRLGTEFGLPVVDSYRAFREIVSEGESVSDYLSQSNHPNRKGHAVVADLILELFRDK
jgi:lysophospholipase L1-like esterase